MPAPAQAVDQQIVWKNDEMRAFAVSLIRRALDLFRAGTFKFTTDIVPDKERGDGHGVAGSVATQLKNASLIETCGIWNDKTFYAERVISEREDAKGRYVTVYRLASGAAAEEFLRRNHVAFKQQNFELAF